MFLYIMYYRLFCVFVLVTRFVILYVAAGLVRHIFFSIHSVVVFFMSVKPITNQLIYESQGIQYNLHTYYYYILNIFRCISEGFQSIYKIK